MSLTSSFQIELAPNWILEIDAQYKPAKYTLIHGKKSLSFQSDVIKDMCARNYGV